MNLIKSLSSPPSPPISPLSELPLAYADGGSDGDGDGAASAASPFAFPHAAHFSLLSQPHEHDHSPGAHLVH